MSNKNAIILLSGGMDSTTCLAIAKHAGYHCYVMSFDYGHRSVAEVSAAEKIAQHFGVEEHKIAKIEIAAHTSALVDRSIEIPEKKPGKREIPVTYVPARNTIFLSIALGYAEEISSRHIFYGANVVDYSNYPDCRPEYIQAFEHLAKLATKVGVEGYAIKIEAPLMYLRKSEIIRRGIDLGVDYSMTVSCYQADQEGRACGKCSSCVQRREGFIQANVPDPTRYY